ncbi:single-stranded DNA-binding protein [soil metagenome]
MANFNKIILVGNLTRDPVLRYLPSQMAVVDFGLAVNHKFRTKTGEDREEVCFIDCSCFGKGAEVINQYCQKGKQLLVEGRLKYDTWEDKQGGGKRSKHVVMVDNFQLMGGPDRTGGGGGRGGDAVPDYDAGEAPAPRSAPQGRPPQANRGPAKPPAQQPYGDEQQFKDEDIPF